MRQKTLAFLALSLLALAALPLHAQQPQQGGAVQGTWTYAGAVEQGTQLIQQAVEPVIGLVTPDLQRFARARVYETAWVPATIIIQSAPDRIHIEYTGAEHRTFETAPGAPQNVYSRSGVRAQMVQVFRPDGGIDQRFTALDGVQVNMLTGNGQQMFLDVSMTAPRLPREIRFRLAYRR